MRKLSFLRRLGIEDAENQFGPIANAERLFAIVGLSMASVCIFIIKILKLRIFKNDVFNSRTWPTEAVGKN